MPDALPPKPRPAGPGLHTLRTAVARSPVLFAATLAAAAATAIGVGLFLPVPKLTAYVLFRIPAAAPHVITPTDREDFHLFRQHQATLITSRLVLNAALRTPAVADAVGPTADKVSTLSNMLKVDFKNGPEFMRLYTEGDDPERALAIVNGVSEAYLSDVVNKKKLTQRDRRGRLEALEATYVKQVEQTVKRLNAQVEQQSGFNGDDSRVLAGYRKAQLLEERLRAEAELRRAEVRLKLLADPAAARQALTETAVRDRLAADPDHRSRLAARNQVRADLEDARTRLQPGRTTPGLQALAKQATDLDAEVTAAEGRAKAEVAAAVAQQAQQQVALDRDDAEGRVKLAQVMVAKVDQELRELAVGSQKSASDLYDSEGLRQRLARERDLLARMQNELTTIQLEADAPDRVNKLEADVVPGVEGNRRVKFGALAGLGVLALGLAGLLARELRSPRVTDARLLAAELDLPMVGALPLLDAHGGPAAVVRAASEASMELHVGAIEAVTAACSVLHHGFGDELPARALLVASAVSGEGKTTVALLLASNMARAGHRTLLVDGDLRRPSLHTHLGTPAGPGVCDLLTGDAALADVVRRTDVPNLSLLPAGRWSRAASYALARGRRWREVMAEAGDQFDYVIVDSSPLLPVADGLLMARGVDGVILSAMRGKSELPPVREAVRQLGAVGKQVLGVVLNGAVSQSYYTYPHRTRPADPADLVPLAAAPTA